MRLAVATDLHLNFVTEPYIQHFCVQVFESKADALLITGDTAEGNSIDFYLRKLVQGLQIPVFLVLGNHDFYRSNTTLVRQQVVQLSQHQEVTLQSPLIYLPALQQPYPLSDAWALVGADGWGDGRVGAFMSTRTVLSDWQYIEEFVRVFGAKDIAARLKVLHRLSDLDAKILHRNLGRALKKYPNIIVATHVPPFEGAAWHEGRISDRYFSPWFVWKAGGDVLLQAAERYTQSNILVLCGHTHSPGVYQPRPNLTVKTLGAMYGKPNVAEVIDCSTVQTENQDL